MDKKLKIFLDSLESYQIVDAVFADELSTLRLLLYSGFVDSREEVKLTFCHLRDIQINYQDVLPWVVFNLKIEETICENEKYFIFSLEGDVHIEIKCLSYAFSRLKTEEDYSFNTKRR